MAGRKFKTTLVTCICSSRYISVSTRLEPSFSWSHTSFLSHRLLSRILDIQCQNCMNLHIVNKFSCKPDVFMIQQARTEPARRGLPCDPQRDDGPESWGSHFPRHRPRTCVDSSSHQHLSVAHVFPPPPRLILNTRPSLYPDAPSSPPVCAVLADSERLYVVRPWARPQSRGCKPQAPK